MYIRKNATWCWCEPTCHCLEHSIIWEFTVSQCEMFSSRLNIFFLVNFGPVTDGRTESDSQEATMHYHRWAQKVYKWSNLTIVMSPPAYVWDANMALTHVTFELDPCDLWPYLKQFLNYEFFTSGFFVVNYFLVTDRRTDRQKAMHCGLKNVLLYIFFIIFPVYFCPPYPLCPKNGLRSLQYSSKGFEQW